MGASFFRVVSYLTASPHMDPFYLLGNIQGIMVVPYVQTEKCIYKVNGIRLRVKYTCYNQHKYYCVLVHYWGIGVNCHFYHYLLDI